MPQLDLTFFFSSALSLLIAYLILLFVFEYHIVPVQMQNIKLRDKITFTNICEINQEIRNKNISNFETYLNSTLKKLEEVDLDPNHE